MSLRHPKICIDDVRALFNLLTLRKRGAEERLNTPSNTITHLEMVFDLELTTSI